LWETPCRRSSPEDKPRVLPEHKGRDLSKLTSRDHLHSHLRSRSSISSGRCRLGFVVLIVFRVTDDRPIHWILVEPRRLGMWFLQGCVRCSGAAMGGATWTPYLRRKLFGMEKRVIVCGSLRSKETRRLMRVMPRVHNPALGRRHETSLHLHPSCIFHFTSL
jgi:hypothetical protein